MSMTKGVDRGLGYIYQRGGVWWVQYRLNGTRYRESALQPHLGLRGTKTDARRLLKQRLGEFANGQFAPDADKVTFADLRKLVHDDYTNQENRSWHRAERAFKRLERTFGMDRAVYITAERLANYAADRQRRGVKRATVAYELAMLKRGFTLAVRAGKLLRVPTFPEFGDIKNARQEFFEDWEYAALYAELPEYMQPVLTFVFFTGWRYKSEVRTLRWEHVDMERGEVSLPLYSTKNQEARTFPFAEWPELSEAFVRQRAYTDVCEQRTGRQVAWVFHQNGRQLNANSNGFYKAWNAACRRAGVLGRDGKAKRPHDCRRSAVRRLEWSGVPRGVAKALVGHKTDEMYDRYAIVRGDDLRAGVKRVARYQSGETKGTPEATHAGR